jgi:hypothetical protein
VLNGGEPILPGKEPHSQIFVAIHCRVDDEQMTPNRELVRKVLHHSLMGAALGASLALTLLVINAHQLLHVIANGPSPGLVLVIFVLWLSGYFSFGASVTGLLLILAED